MMGGGEDDDDDGHHHHSITIWEVNKDLLTSMQDKISKSPQILSSKAGRSSCCIFRVPQSFIDINGRAYEPHIVSIGPYHRGKPQLQMIEEQKWRYLRSLLSRTQSKGIVLEDYLKAIQPLEMKARECYSESIPLEADEFIELLVLDGCFIIEIFRKRGLMVRVDSDDPLFSMSWIIPFFWRDFLRIENQVPFFILQQLYDLTISPKEESEGKTLTSLALQFFNQTLNRDDKVIEGLQGLQGMHLLDLLRCSFISSDLQEPRTSEHVHVIHCVSKLRKAGIKLKKSDKDSFLVINFRRGILEMPNITIDDFMSCFLLNSVAFEQCHKNASNHFTTYATLLDCLINTSKDVEYLCDQNIIENYFGTDAEVARFINNLGKDVAFDFEQCYLCKLFDDVHHYYSNSWHVQVASFKHTYFDTPWSFVSAVAALVLLILTMLQTFYTVYPYVKATSLSAFRGLFSPAEMVAHSRTWHDEHY